MKLLTYNERKHEQPNAQVQNIPEPLIKQYDLLLRNNIDLWIVGTNRIGQLQIHCRRNVVSKGIVNRNSVSNSEIMSQVKNL